MRWLQYQRLTHISTPCQEGPVAKALVHDATRREGRKVNNVEFGRKGEARFEILGTRKREPTAVYLGSGKLLWQQPSKDTSALTLFILLGMLLRVLRCV